MSAGAADALSARPAAWSLNARAVFDTLLTHGMLTRGEIAEFTGLSRVTASGVVEQLIRRGIVEYAATVPWSSGGPNARTYALSPRSAYVVGVAAYLDRIVVTTSTITGQIVGETTQDVSAGDDTAARVHELILASLAAASAPVGRLRRVVVGTQGVVDPSEHEQLTFVTNVRSWQSELTSVLREALGCPVVLENDVNLAAIAEMHSGAGRDVQDLVLAWIDDGVALGSIVRRRLLRGDNGWAGEIGFIRMGVTGPDDNYGQIGEVGPHVCTLQSALGSLGVYALGEHFGVPRADFLAQLRDGFPHVDESAALLDEIAHRVVHAVAPPILILDPDAVVLTGCVAKAGGQRLLDLVVTGLKEFGPLPLPLTLSQVDSDAIVHGAVLLALADARDTLFDGTRFDDIDPEQP